MKQIESEADFRGWLRRAWLDDLWGPLIWVEAARGGTVGAPDVFVPVPGSGYVAVELKFWPRKAKRGARSVLERWEPIRIEMRPAQRRLHSLIGVAGYRSAVLAYIGFGEIGLAEGWRIARDPDEKFIHRRHLDVGEFRNLLTLAIFWRGESYATMARAQDPQQLGKKRSGRAGKVKSR